MFYSIKEKGYSARDKRVIETEFNRKAELEAQMAEDKAREEQRLAEEEAGPVVKRPGVGAKKAQADGVVKKPILGKGRRRGF